MFLARKICEKITFKNVRNMTKISQNIHQINNYQPNLNQVDICLNIDYLNFKFYSNIAVNPNFDVNNYKYLPKLKVTTVNKGEFVWRNSLVASIYNENLMVEHLFYAPRDGTVIDINKSVINNIDSIYNRPHNFTKTNQYNIIKLKTENPNHHGTCYS